MTDHSSLLRRRSVLKAALGAAAAVSAGGLARSAVAQEAAPPAAMKGMVAVHDHGAVRIHDYQAPEDSVLVHSVLVEGPTSLVLFDAQLLIPYATEVAEYAASLGKPLERIVVSHTHADHWSGLQTVKDRFPGVPVFALGSVRDFIATTGDAVLANRAATPFGPLMAQAAVVPDEVLPVGAVTIDGVEYEFEEFADGEADHQLVARLPRQRTLLAFDLVYARNSHGFAENAEDLDHWAEILEALEAKEFDALLFGHGTGDRADIAATIEYVRGAKAAHEAAASPEEWAAAVKAAFPNRQHPGWADFTSLLMYGVIDP